MFQLMDYNVTNTSLILLALFEVVAVAWVYGTERLSEDYFHMTGQRLSSYFTVCLKFLAPLLILVWEGDDGGFWYGKGEAGSLGEMMNKRCLCPVICHLASIASRTSSFVSSRRVHVYIGNMTYLSYHSASRSYGLPVRTGL